MNPATASHLEAHASIAAWRPPLLAALPADLTASKALRAQITRALVDLFEDLVKRLGVELMIEVGAHEATASTEIKRALPDVRVVAFEANPEIFVNYWSRLRAEGVEYINAMVADADGSRRLFVPQDERGRRLRMASMMIASKTDAAAAVAIQAPSLTLDSFFRAQIGQSVALWIDVEGGVGPVLDGARELLDGCLVLLAELESQRHWQGQKLEGEVVGQLAAHGLIPVASDLQRPSQFNVLFVRAAAVDDELQAACEAYREQSARIAHSASHGACA